MKSGAAEFRFVALPADDFPGLPRFEKVHFVKVDPKCHWPGHLPLRIEFG